MIILNKTVKSISELLPAMKYLAGSSDDLCRLRGPNEFLVIDSHTKKIQKVREAMFTISITAEDPRIHKRWSISSHEMEALGELLKPGCCELKVVSNIEGVENFKYKSIFGEIIFAFGMLHFKNIKVPAEFMKIIQQVDKLFST